MAAITARYTWAEHQSIEVEIYVDDSYPDALDEARAQARRAVRDILTDVITAEAHEQPDA